ncbi:hypothetical protein [Streptomyces sp. NPDC047070]|uniref:hypothetical protein n=1 Tax=Streptomyces sp. NPDC047070 TaxID=3154923 RepID=UPI0034520D40
MTPPEHRRRRRPPASGEETWVTFAMEFTRSVLSDRSRTLNAVMLLSIPLVSVTGTVVTIVAVLVPHPAMALGALGSSMIIALVAWVRRRLEAPGAAQPPEPGATDPTPPGPSTPQSP